MVYGFWKNLPRPIIGLAPMDGVTDAAFRFIVAKYGKPAVMMTEFTSVEGIRAGAERLLDDFLYSPIERPVVAQLFGADPAAFFIGAVAASALGFDGLDINMGCPAKNVTERGAGAALIADPERAKEIVRQTRAGTQAWSNGISLKEAGLHDGIANLITERRAAYGLTERTELPVSIKTRLGVSTITITDWIPHLLEVEPVNITIHGRTLKQLYTGEANWEAIADGARLVKEAGFATVLGNGDIKSLEDAHERSRIYGTDGALIGRSSFGNPWVFTPEVLPMTDLKAVALEHARVLQDYFGGRGFIRIRKHLMDYFKGDAEAKALRLQLMRVTNLEEVEELLKP